MANRPPGLPWPNNLTTDFGGAGVFTTAPDYLKALKSLLHNDGKLLKPASVDLMFSPQLDTTEHMTKTLATSGPTSPYWEAMAQEHPIGREWQFGLGGKLQLGEHERFREGTLSWGGLPNLRWWIDRKAGVCGVFATQLLPPGSAEAASVNNEFEKDVFANMRVK